MGSGKGGFFCEAREAKFLSAREEKRGREARRDEVVGSVARSIRVSP
jgi:hypothetical protein